MQLNLFGFQNIKKCTKCDKILSLDLFYKRSSPRNDYQSSCKKCSIKSKSNWQKNNIEKRKKYLKNWNLKNKDKQKIYRANWSKKRSNYEKNRCKNDYLFYLKRKIRQSIRNSFNRNGYKKNTKTAYILGADWFSFKKHIENQFTSDMSWDDFDKIHLDHKIPIAAASTEFEVIALNHYTNLQPLWAEDNLSKSDKYDPEDFKKYMDWYRKNVKSNLD